MRPVRSPAVRRALYGMAFGAVVAVALPIGWVFPYFRDDYVLDGIVRAVALDWRDFGQDKAQARLEHELDHRGIGLWVGDEACQLVTSEHERRVTCQWVVSLAAADVSLPLAFRSSAAIDRDGNLRP